MTPEETAENSVITALSLELLQVCQDRPINVMASALVTALSFVIATEATDHAATLEEIHASLRAGTGAFIAATKRVRN